jgi:hypothetical protein
LKLSSAGAQTIEEGSDLHKRVIVESLDIQRCVSAWFWWCCLNFCACLGSEGENDRNRVAGEYVQDIQR